MSSIRYTDESEDSRLITQIDFDSDLMMMIFLLLSLDGQESWEMLDD